MWLPESGRDTNQRGVQVRGSQEAHAPAIWMSLSCSQAHVSAHHSCFMQGSYVHMTGITSDRSETGISFLPPETAGLPAYSGNKLTHKTLGGEHYDEASRDLKIVGNDCSTLDQSTWGGGLRSSEDRTAFRRPAGRGSPGSEVRHGGQGFPSRFYHQGAGHVAALLSLNPRGAKKEKTLGTVCQPQLVARAPPHSSLPCGSSAAKRHPKS